MIGKISVIVPTYNSERTIGKTIKAVLNQNYPKKKYELIIVDDGSSDKTVDVVKKIKSVRFFKQKHKGAAAARNFGVKKSKGNIILFTDADCVPGKNWIKNMVKPFADKNVIAVSGTYKTMNNDSLIARFVGLEIDERHRKLQKRQSIDFVGTFSGAYRKEIFRKIRGFDESFTTADGEDMEISFRAEKFGKMVFADKAFVYHRHPDSLSKFLKQKFSRGIWRFFVYRKQKHKVVGDSYTPKSLYLELSLAGMIFLSFLLGFLEQSFFLLSSLCFILLFIIGLPLSIRMFLRDKSVGLATPAILVLRDFALGFGLVYGMLKMVIQKVSR